MKMHQPANGQEKSGMSFLRSVLQTFAYQEKPFLDETGQKRKTHILILVILTAACLLPFAGKAFNMDDPLFIWTAKNIPANPLDPYGFNVNWYGTGMRMSDVNKNPPLVSYFMAVVGSVFEWNEYALHIAFFLPAMAVIIGTYLIARRYCANPMLASLAALFTPVFLVSSTTIMSDVMMLAFWVFAVYFWIAGLEKNSHFLLLLSVILASLCALSKYFGIALLPLLLLYSLLKNRKIGRWILYLLVPVAVLAAYQWATSGLYGRGLLTDASSYAIEFPSTFGKFPFAKVLVGLSFTGGCALSVLFFTHLIWSWREISIGALLLVIVMVITASTGSLGNYRLPGETAVRWLVALELGLFISGGMSLLVIAFLDFMHRRDADSNLLFLWFIGTLVFAAFVNWTTAARSILPLVPAAGILIARRIEQRGNFQKNISLRQILIPLAGAAAVALAVTWADSSLANSARTASTTIIENYMTRQNNIWFSGHWGFQYYMERFGARPFDIDRSMPAAGDTFIVPGNNTNPVELPAQLVRLREVLEVPYGGWITTMNLTTGAGFYSDTWGPLPFAVGVVPSEQYHIYEVKGL